MSWRNRKRTGNESTSGGAGLASSERRGKSHNPRNHRNEEHDERGGSFHGDRNDLPVGPGNGRRGEGDRGPRNRSPDNAKRQSARRSHSQWDQDARSRQDKRGRSRPSRRGGHPDVGDGSHDDDRRRFDCVSPVKRGSERRDSSESRGIFEHSHRKRHRSDRGGRSAQSSRRCVARTIGDAGNDVAEDDRSKSLPPGGPSGIPILRGPPDSDAHGSDTDEVSSEGSEEMVEWRREQLAALHERNITGGCDMLDEGQVDEVEGRGGGGETSTEVDPFLKLFDSITHSTRSSTPNDEASANARRVVLRGVEYSVSPRHFTALFRKLVDVAPMSCVRPAAFMGAADALAADGAGGIVVLEFSTNDAARNAHKILNGSVMNGRYLQAVLN